MFHQFRRAAARITWHLFTATGTHRQHLPLSTRISQPASAGLRRQPALLFPHPDDQPVVRPYLLTPEEWARRRAESRPRDVAQTL